MTLLADLLSVCPQGAHVLGAAFRGDPHAATRGDWFAHKAEAGTVWDNGNGEGLNKYLCVSAFSDVVRRKDTFVAQLAVMIDDLGGTIAAGMLPEGLPPTWMIETSRGNFQAWYVLQDPITDRAMAEGLVAALQAKGFCKPEGGDTGFAGVTRYGRCEKGINGKPGSFVKGQPWKVRGRRVGGLVTVAEVLEGFGIDAADLTKRRKAASGGAGPQSDLELAEALAGDTLAAWLAEQGMVTRWRDDGWLDITCPWVDEHTGGADNGTAYRVARFSGSGRGGFKCHHGSHVGRGLSDLWKWAEGEGWQNPWSVPDAADEFQVLDDDGEPVALAVQDRLAARYVWVPGRGAFLDFETGDYVSSSALEGAVSSLEGIEHERGKDSASMFGFNEPGPKGKPVFYRLGTWLRYIAGCVVDSVTWEPGEGRIFERDGLRFANIWKPLEQFPRSEARPWVEHVRMLYPDQAEAIFDWLAYVAQNPAGKVNHALVLGGPQGCGKNAVLAPFELLEGFAGSTKISEVMGGFGDWAYGVKVAIINEAKRSKDYSADDVHNALKTFIARPPYTLRINGKYKPMLVCPNLLAAAITTNYIDGLHLDKGDRRYLICWTDQVPSPEYFSDLFTWIDGGGWREAFGWLQARDLSHFRPGAPPAWTDATQEAYESGRADDEVMLEEWLLDHDVVAVGSLQAALEFEHGAKEVPKARRLVKLLGRLGWVKLQSDTACGRWKVAGKMQQVYFREGMSEGQAEAGLEALRKQKDD